MHYKIEENQTVSNFKCIIHEDLYYNQWQNQIVLCNTTNRMKIKQVSALINAYYSKQLATKSAY